ncbi:MAG TPA: RNB domain-containing ribonuclease [Nitrospirota bacterium]|nr:RNB domain-containing ribonuclease [Nitrospirota bacterium]
MHPNIQDRRTMLQRIARRVMLERGLAPDFSRQALAELAAIQGPAAEAEGPMRDLRDLPWCSIDNDDSRDLDQLTAAETRPDSSTRILVAIADVDALVRKNSAIDEHAQRNTTSVYTEAVIFPMLPEKLSTDLTSLNYAEVRHAVVIDMVFGRSGSLQESDVYGALVRNKAKLAYRSVAAWLEGEGAEPPAISAVAGLADNLRLQDRTAQMIKSLRHEHGALTLETIEMKLVFDDGDLKEVGEDVGNRAKDIIENFMIAANGVTSRFIAAKDLPSLRRIVRTPKRWDRIREIALERNFELAEAPDSKSLESFLTQAKASDPDGFPDLSLSVIKLMGPGEYAVQMPGSAVTGHFGLAVKDYAHSTAPNRRYPDIITQRLIKSTLTGSRVPYEHDELEALARHCTEMEDAAKKVERQVRKSAAAMLLEHRIGELFDAIVTGAAAKGTWVRLMHPPIEGRLVSGFEGADVGHRMRVQLTHTDVEQGFIDFKKVE